MLRSSRIVVFCITFLAALLGALSLVGTASAQSGGPVVLLGIDAEDGHPGGHGPNANYAATLTDVLADATKGSGVLVIGGGKAPGDAVTGWWTDVVTGAGSTPTFVNGAAAISAVDFTPFEVIGVASSATETPSGGLTQAENDALVARNTDIAAHVNSGGGLFGLTQAGFANPFAYVFGFGTFSTTEDSFSNITPTPAGTAVGVTDALDVCCWHNTFTTFPSFLNVLATNGQQGTATFGQAAALGGEAVILNPPPPSPVTNPGPQSTQAVSTGRASLKTTRGCPKKSVKARVTGTGIKQVAFSVDGKKIGTDRKAPFKARIKTTSVGFGSHSMTAKVTLSSGGTRTLKSKFVRCRPPKPKFTG